MLNANGDAAMVVKKQNDRSQRKGIGISGLRKFMKATALTAGVGIAALAIPRVSHYLSSVRHYREVVRMYESAGLKDHAGFYAEVNPVYGKYFTSSQLLRIQEKARELGMHPARIFYTGHKSNIAVSPNPQKNDDSRRARIAAVLNFLAINPDLVVSLRKAEKDRAFKSLEPSLEGYLSQDYDGNIDPRVGKQELRYY